MKKVTAFFVAAVMFFTIAFPVSADTADATDYSKFYAVISNGLKTSASSIDVAEFELDRQEFQTVYMEALYNNPECFWVADYYSIMYNEKTNIVKSVIPKYNDLLTDANIEKFEKAIQKALVEIDDSLDEYEKVLILHDYLVNTCNYVIDNNKPVYTSYAALVNREALCRGYARAMKLLLNRVGINSIIVCSDEMNHAWNMVEIDGEWYQLDATWDDPTGGIERVSHDFILLSDETLRDSYHLHRGWVSNYTALSTKYESGFWLESQSQVHYGDNNFYYIKDSAIVSRNRESGSETVIYNFTDLWYLWQNSSYYYLGTYSGLSLIDGKLYFNTPAGVYSISTTGEGLSEVYTLSKEEQSQGRIFATSYRGGEFTYTLATDPSNEDFTVKIIDLDTQQSGDDAHTHSYITLVTAPTCTEVGYTAYTCTCGYSYTTNEVTAVGHDLTTTTVNATCTEAGSKTTTCSRCDYESVEEITATDHNFGAYEVTKKATCTEDGVMTGTCTACGSEATEVIPAQGHSYTSVVTVPTCTTGGYTTYTCSVCDDSYTGDKAQALGHDLTTTTVDATCTTKGSETTTCSRCDYKNVVEIELLDHTESGWIVDENATETTEGHRHTECTVCGKVIREGTIPVIGTITVLYGDANGDGKVTILDAMAAASHGSGLTELTGTAFDATDVDGNNRITVLDAVIIARYSAGLINLFPVDGK